MEVRLERGDGGLIEGNVAIALEGERAEDAEGDGDAVRDAEVRGALEGMAEGVAEVEEETFFLSNSSISMKCFLASRELRMSASSEAVLMEVEGLVARCAAKDSGPRQKQIFAASMRPEANWSRRDFLASEGSM